MAKEESRQARLNNGSLREPSVGFGSKIRENCWWKGVATRVENVETVNNAKNLIK